MAIIIDNQQISKRRRTAYGTKPTNKSAGFNSGFMSHFEQKPANKRKRETKNVFTPFRFPSVNKSSIRRKPAEGIKHKPFSFTGGKWLFPFGTNRKKTLKASLREHKLNFRDENPNKEKKSSGFSFPVPSLATLAVAAGTVVIALTALNWEDLNIKIPDIYDFQPVAGDDTERHTMRYAETGISSILENDIENLQIFNTPNDVTSESIENDSPHGTLFTFEWQQYKVLRGDSVSAIAEKFGVSVGAIIASNEIRNARLLQEGAILKIPNIDGIPYQVQRGDSLSRISASFNVPLEVILDVNDIKSDNIMPGEILFIPGARMNEIDLRLSLGETFMYPLQSRFITSNYGWRKDPFNGSNQFHDGIDFRASIGTTVMASLDGVVSVVGESRLYGKFIIISHSNGYKTLYGHLRDYSVKEGDRVARGRKIGETGNTGYSTGPHLHFGMYDKNGKVINPLDLLK